MKRLPLGVVSLFVVVSTFPPGISAAPPRSPSSPRITVGPDTVIYKGHVHTPLGAATLGVDGDSLLVASGIGASSSDGVAIHLTPRARGLELHWGAGTTLGGSAGVGATLTTTARGIAGGVPATLVTLRRQVFPGKLEMRADFSTVGAASESLEVLNGGVRVYYQVVPNLTPVDLIFDPSAARSFAGPGGDPPNRMLVSEPIPGIDVVIKKTNGFAVSPDSGLAGHDVVFATGAHTFYIAGSVVRGDRVRFTQASGAGVTAITALEVRAMNPGGSSLSRIEIRDEVDLLPAPGPDSLDFGGLAHRRLGEAVLSTEGDSLLRVAGIGVNGDDGVSVGLDSGATGFGVTWSTPVLRDPVDAGATVTVTTRGVVGGVPHTPVLVVTRLLAAGEMQIRAHFSVGAATETVEVRRGGVRVHYQAVPNNQLVRVIFGATPLAAPPGEGPPTVILGKGDPLGGIDVGHVDKQSQKLMFAAPSDTTEAQHTFTFATGIQEIAIGAVHVFGDQVRFAQGPGSYATSLTDFEIRATNYGGSRLTSFTLHGEEQSFPPEPEIVSVRDVPDDQGGKVLVLWSASGLDGHPLFRIGSYTLWRLVTTAFAAAAMERGAPLFDDGPPSMLPSPGSLRVTGDAAQALYWEFICSIPARGASGYGYTAPTTADSTGASTPWNVFFVDASESETAAFHVSDPDSGYSVDNLPPATPVAFTGEYEAGSRTTMLHWLPNTEADFSVYRLHRGSAASFEPGPGNLIATLPDTGHADADVDRSHYKLVAMDVHGNASTPAALFPNATTGAPDPVGTRLLWLGPTTPNPARTAASFALRLPRGAAVRVSVHDAVGRRTRLVHAGTLPEGEHVVSWDLRDDRAQPVAGGLYFVRVEVASQVLRRRLVVVP